MYYLSLDKDGYLLSVSLTGDGPAVETLDGLDLSGNRIGAYRWDGDALTLDTEQLARLEAETRVRDVQERVAQLTAALRETDAVVLEALEGLFTVTTITGFIAALVSAAKSVRATLEDRGRIREQIAELTNKEDQS